jgi:hypothetical protein
MPSEAAKQVKFGFWIAAGFWAFFIVLAFILLLCIRALGE